MRVATWNVNSIRMRLPRLLAWLERQQPDVACLQETKVEDERFPVAEIEAHGYRALYAGERMYNGVAILWRAESADGERAESADGERPVGAEARRPVGAEARRAGSADVVRCLPDDGPDSQRRILVTTIDGVRIVNVYAPNGNPLGSEKYAYKLGWYRRLRAYLDQAFDPRADVLVCGDFNVAPEDRDVWDPEQWRGQVLFTEPEKEAFRALQAWGLADALRIHRPEDGGLYTWWDYRAGAFHRNLGLRIDHVLLSPSLAGRSLGVEIDRAERKGKSPSDHAPVIATLAPRPP